ncbi:MAG: hypothetical protein J7513_16895 [Solirubrobacteraceae bacterium]|nr:hypothetical protein [Solirubrobacteraceae bacterium]
MSVADDDWRRAGQETVFPPGTSWQLKLYRAWRPNWEHDHCVMCWAKLAEPGFSEAHRELTESDGAVLARGYTTTAEHPAGAGYHWLCEACFADFKEEFGWVAMPAS